MTNTANQRDPRQAPDHTASSGDDTIHDEHTVEPAEGSPEPGIDAETDIREHPSEPAEGRTDIEG